MIRGTKKQCAGHKTGSLSSWLRKANFLCICFQGFLRKAILLSFGGYITTDFTKSGELTVTTFSSAASPAPYNPFDKEWITTLHHRHLGIMAVLNVALGTKWLKENARGKVYEKCMNWAEPSYFSIAFGIGQQPRRGPRGRRKWVRLDALSHSAGESLRHTPQSILLTS